MGDKADVDPVDGHLAQGGAAAADQGEIGVGRELEGAPTGSETQITRNRVVAQEKVDTGGHRLLMVGDTDPGHLAHRLVSPATHRRRRLADGDQAQGTAMRRQGEPGHRLRCHRLDTRAEPFSDQPSLRHRRAHSSIARAATRSSGVSTSRSSPVRVTTTGVGRRAR